MLQVTPPLSTVMPYYQLPAFQDLPKRTRVGIKQSKNGCITCKARRIKCDEQRPFCLRCTQSRKICQGYPSKSRPEDNKEQFALQSVSKISKCHVNRALLSKNASNLSYPLHDCFQISSNYDRLSRLGCQVITYNKYREGSNLSRSILDQLLPQLSHAIPSVYSAAAALGAVYEGCMLSNSSSQSDLIAEGQYNLALRTLQEEIVTQPYGMVPLLLACLLLSCVEILQHRYSNAMTHLRGAFHVLSERLRLISETSSPDIRSHSQSVHCSPDSGHVLAEDGFTFLFQTFDTHRPSYVLGRPPEMPNSFFHSSIDPPFALGRLGISMRLVPVMHSCYHFIAKASQHRDQPSASLLPEILVEQGRRVAELSSWLKNLDDEILHISTGTSHESLSGPCRHTMMLRAQCLIMIIIISTITSHSETAYDNFAPQFQQIVRNSDAALGTNQDYLYGLGQFYVAPGVTQPLFFTALKYRHPIWRRQAVNLLRRAGREGPWDGQLLAAVASRVVEIEEAEKASVRLDEMMTTSLREEDRINGCLMDVEAGEGQAIRFVRVEFNRCHGLDESSSAEAHWADKRNWCTWNEDVKF